MLLHPRSQLQEALVAMAIIMMASMSHSMSHLAMLPHYVMLMLMSNIYYRLMTMMLLVQMTTVSGCGRWMGPYHQLHDDTPIGEYELRHA